MKKRTSGAVHSAYQVGVIARIAACVLPYSGCGNPPSSLNRRRTARVQSRRLAGLSRRKAGPIEVLLTEDSRRT